MSSSVKVAIIGASGYTGLELLRLIFMHPNAEVVAITSRANAGKTVTEVFPRFSGHPGTELEFPAPELLEEGVFGLPEVHGELIKKARLVASPGCYPTSIMLPLIPLLKKGLIELDSIAVSSMSGVSGAGRNAAIPLIFAEVNESVRSYGMPRHRHLSEIEQELSKAAGEKVTISFVPHLIPVTAGICTTTFAKLKGDFSEVGPALEEAYGKNSECHFVRLRGEGASPDTKNVVGTNFLDIGWHHDVRTGRLILQSTEDNLGKGAAGQAVQSFNLMNGFLETAGLQNI